MSYHISRGGGGRWPICRGWWEVSWSVTRCLTSHTGLGVHSLHECTYVAKHDEDIGSMHGYHYFVVTKC